MVLSALDFKGALSSLPAGVVIVTSATESGQPVGATVSAFCSLSLEPPLVLACLNAESRSAQAIRARGAYSIHILSCEQAELARRFASDGAEKFDSTVYDLSADGVPCLRECAVRLDCNLEHDYPGGDHVILVGRVKAVQLVDEFRPLVYARRSFFGLGEPLAL